SRVDDGNTKMNPVNDLLLEFVSPRGKYALTFDDDGKVTYAYLKKGGRIVGDVWLYNRCETPAEPEWKDRKNIPFANCEGYISKAGRMEKAILPQDVHVNWKWEGAQPVAYVYVFEDLLGVVGLGDKPGNARFAIKDNRLARVMVIEG